MNNARMWLVVNPTVGLPLFLGGVAVTSLVVHAYVLNNTTWFADYWGGKEINSASATVESPTQTAEAAAEFTASVGAGEAFIVLPDGRTGRVVFDPPVTLAAAGSGAAVTAPPD